MLKSKRSIAAVLIGAAIFWCAGAAAAAVPAKLAYEGRLLTSVGTPVTTAKTVIFKIFDDPAAGNLLWTSATYTATPDASGVFTVVLGSAGDPIGSTVFSAAGRYLEVNVAGEAILPRSELVSAAYAYRAAVADSFAGNSITGTLTVDAGNLIVSSGSVGIGTTSPGAKLDINGGNSDLIVGKNGAYGVYTRIAGGTTKPWFATASTNTVFYNTNTGSIIWRNSADNADLMSMTNAGVLVVPGSVGIGTTSPGAKLAINAGGSNHMYLGQAGDNANYNIISLNGTLASPGHIGIEGGGVDDGNLYLDSVSQLYFRPGNSNTVRMAIMNTGNVGIGTTAPAQKLSVAGTIEITSGSGGELKFADGTIQTTAGGSQWTTSGSNIYNNNSGNVGIGTTAPAATFEVGTNHTFVVNSGNGFVSFGTASPANGTLTLQNGDGHNNVVFCLNSTSGTLLGALGAVGYANDWAGPSAVGDVFLRAQQNLQLVTSGNGLTRMTVASGGNVGIGTTNPEALLSVSGAVSLSPTGNFYNEGLRIHASSADDYSTIQLGAVPGATGTGVGQWNLIRYPSANSYLFGLRYNSTDLFNITSDGSVGIGTTGPGDKLDVNGGGIRVSTVRQGAGTGALNIENTSSFTAKNASGSYEEFLWPRWSDNIMYLNYGSAGFNIRNSAGVPTMFMNNSSNVGIGTTAPAQKLSVAGTIELKAGYGGGLKFADGTIQTTAGGSQWTTSGSNIYNNNSGYVGIGTTAPAMKLEVYGSTNGTIPDISIQNNQLNYPQYILKARNAASNQQIWRMISRNTPDFEIQTLDDSYAGEVTAMQINRSGTAIANVNFPNGNVAIGTPDPGSAKLAVLGGNVGIGTTAPAMQLEVYGNDAWQTNAIQINQPNVPELFMKSRNAAADQKIWRFISRNTADFELQTLNDSYAGEQTAMQVNRSGTAIANVNFPNGNVGIGTTSPAVQLEIKSTTNPSIRVTTSADNDWLGSMHIMHQSGKIVAWGIIPNNVGAALYPEGGLISVNDGTNWHDMLQFSTTGTEAAFGDPDFSGTAVKLKITGNLQVGTSSFFVNQSAGNVGIGTTAPASKLEVSGGDIRVTGGSFIDDGTTLAVPDYVFKEDYSLKSIAEVKKFVQKNKHLEGVPDMSDKKGWAALSLQDRDMKLLEKIEELTLYVIRLEEKVKQLEAKEQK